MGIKLNVRKEFDGVYFDSATGMYCGLTYNKDVQHSVTIERYNSSGELLEEVKISELMRSALGFFFE